ncbi:hypothetical protein QEN19_004012 [Hanseniaspora menglaensis]
MINTIIGKSSIRLSKYTRLNQFANIRFISTNKSVEEIYKEKLLQKAKDQGFKTIEELKEHLKEDLDKKKIEFSKIDPLEAIKKYQDQQATEETEDMNKPTSKTLGPVNTPKQETPYKTLSSYVEIEKFMELSPQEIEYIWRARFSSANMAENHLHSVLNKDTWNKLFTTAKENPIFVLPLPRDITPEQRADGQIEKGSELFYVQWLFPDSNTTHVIITSLIEYQLHKEFAKPYLTISFFTDLMARKQVALMMGQLDLESSLSLSDCTLLLLNLQRFYGVIGGKLADERIKILQSFNKGDVSFDVNKLVELSESVE